MKCVQKGLFSLSCLLMLLLFSNAARAQDPVKLNPAGHKVLVDEADVRVYEVTFKPGEKMAMHWHPKHVVYSFSNGELTLTDKTGKAEKIPVTVGMAMSAPEGSHTSMNSGNTELRLLVVEMKGMKMMEKMEKKTEMKEKMESDD